MLDVIEENGSGDMAKVIEAFNTLSVSEVSTAMEAVTGSSLTGIANALQTQSQAVSQQITSRLNSLHDSPTVTSFADEFDRGVLLAMNDGSASMLPVYAAALGAASAQRSATNAHSGFWLRGLSGAGKFDVASTADADLRTVGVLGGFEAGIALCVVDRRLSIVKFHHSRVRRVIASDWVHTLRLGLAFATSPRLQPARFNFPSGRFLR